MTAVIETGVEAGFAEQIFLQLRDELPYASTVETEAWEEFKDGSAKISADNAAANMSGNDAPRVG